VSRRKRRRPVPESERLNRTLSNGSPPRHDRGGMDPTVLTLVLVLIALGTLMVYSASSAVATERFGDSAWYLKRHLLRAGLGLALMFILARARQARIVRLGRPLLIVAIVLLCLVLLPGLGGVSSNGASRWLAFGPLSFQPSELARFALLLWLADVLVERRNTLTNFREGLVPVLVPVAAVLVLVVVEDFSTAVALGLIAVAMILLAGARPLHLAGLGAAALPLICFAMMGSPYRRARLAAYLEHGSGLQDANYQVWQSLIGLGDGGLLGKGLGHSAQKLRFLPEPFNDFIYSIIGEELGFIGAVVVLILFMLLVVRGLRIAGAAPSGTGALLAAGISITIGIYALINVGVVTALLPATGLALPFISYGGSSLIFSLAGAGLLLSVSRETDLAAGSKGRGLLP